MNLIAPSPYKTQLGSFCYSCFHASPTRFTGFLRLVFSNSHKNTPDVSRIFYYNSI